MLKIAAILFPVIATTLMGVAVIAVLTIDMQAGWRDILWPALAAFIAALPISWFIARQIPGIRQS